MCRFGWEFIYATSTTIPMEKNLFVRRVRCELRHLTLQFSHTFRNSLLLLPCLFVCLFVAAFAYDGNYTTILPDVTRKYCRKLNVCFFSIDFCPVCKMLEKLKCVICWNETWKLIWLSQTVIQHVISSEYIYWIENKLNLRQDSFLRIKWHTTSRRLISYIHPIFCVNQLSIYFFRYADFTIEI